MVKQGRADRYRAQDLSIVHFYTRSNNSPPTRTPTGDYQPSLRSPWLAAIATVSTSDKPIQCRERLGGMLNFYYREAA
jgi:hypothetical protein